MFCSSWKLFTGIECHWWNCWEIWKPFLPQRSTPILFKVDVGRGSTLFRKLSLDASRWAASAWLKRGCLASSTWRLRSFMLATRLLISGGAIPARIISAGVKRRHHVIRQQQALRVMLIFFACVDLSYTGHRTQQQSSRVLRQLTLVSAV